MGFTRTRIWRGGIEALGVARDEASIPDARPPEDGRAAAEIHTAHPRERLSPDRADEPSALSDVEITPPSPLETTRFMPIETLFPEQARQAEVPDTGVEEIVGEPEWLKTWSPVSLAARLRKWTASGGSRGRVVLAAAVLIALALLIGKQLSNRQDEAAKLRNPLAASPTESTESRTDRRVNEPNVALKAPQQAPSTPDLAPTQGLERSAVDALIAGDFETAERLYEKLSQGRPSPSSFGEAYRILATRKTQLAP